MITVKKRLIQCFFGKKVVIDALWQDCLHKKGIHHGAAWEQVEGDELVSRAPSIRAYRMSSDHGYVYFKRQILSLKSGLAFWLRPSKAVVECWSYGRLNDIGIPCPELLAFGEKRRFGVLVSTFLVTKEVPDTQDLLSFSREFWYFQDKQEKQRICRQIIDQLAPQLRLAHDRHFFHHDIKWRNLLVQREDDNFNVFWIDSPRASRMVLRKKRGVMVDLSCLARVAIGMLSPYERVRFLYKYLGKNREKGELRYWVQRVDSHLSRRPPKPFVPPQPKT